MSCLVGLQRETEPQEEFKQYSIFNNLFENARIIQRAKMSVRLL